LGEFHRKLTEELVSFVNSWDNLKKSVEDEYDFENFSLDYRLSFFNEFLEIFLYLSNIIYNLFN